jgi:hypothetical protein
MRWLALPAAIVSTCLLAACGNDGAIGSGAQATKARFAEGQGKSYEDAVAAVIQSDPHALRNLGRCVEDHPPGSTRYTAVVDLGEGNRFDVALPSAVASTGCQYDDFERAAKTLGPPIGDDAFAAPYAQAEANARQGDFGPRLASALSDAPKLAGRLDACQRQQTMRVYGYLEFTEGGGYRARVRPMTQHAKCIEAALEHHELPEPPTRPYVHAFGVALESAPAR